MDTYTLRLPRWTRPPGDRNPLQPAGDRIDRIVVVLAIVVTLLAAPVAAGVGTAVYDANRELYAQQAITRQNITATVIDGSIAPDLRRNSVRVAVEWSWAATQHTGTVRVSPTVKAGDTVEIWVDENGSMVGPPKPATTAVLDAAVVAAVTWLTVAAMAAFVVAGVRALHMKMRDEAWQRDIDRLFDRD
jgi:hypothetical protein